MTTYEEIALKMLSKYCQWCLEQDDKPSIFGFKRWLESNME